MGLDRSFLHGWMRRIELSQASHQSLQSKMPPKASPGCPMSYPTTTLPLITSPLHF